ncbi:capsid assembly scaffolding protein Gp46 family protein [Bacillus amyloliquefaciens]|uniref:capsid assembly scaffolding protein Gp46 family protein n=1 Tax=Bacillus amyloliquefaciens TaxID=1390 RepID=UPI003CF2FBF3
MKLLNKKEFGNLNSKMKDLKPNARIEKMKSIALKTASDKKIPADLIDLLVSDNEEVTLGNLQNLKSL